MNKQTIKSKPAQGVERPGKEDICAEMEQLRHAEKQKR